MSDEGLRPLSQQFSFEGSAVKLEDGSWFQPLRDARRCWTATSPMPYRHHGTYYDSLYELQNGLFVRLQFTAPPLDRSAGRTSMIDCHDDIKGNRIDDREAVEFLIEGQFPVLERLQHLLLDESAPADDAEPQTPRPLSYWEVDSVLGTIHKDAHVMRVADLLPKVLDAAINAVHEIRQWPAVNPDLRQHLQTINLAARLRDRYRVDAREWWGSQKIVPPESVDILQLRWPDGIENVKSNVIPEMGKLVVGAAVALHLNTPLRANEPPPTYEEKRLAETHLLTSLSAIEELVVELRQTLDDLTSGRTYASLMEEAPEKLKPPKKEQIAAYLLRTLSQLSNAEIKKKLKVTVDLGTISRWIKIAREWYEKGNPLPPTVQNMLAKEKAKAAVPVPMDPSEIDLGARQRGRNPSRKGSESD
ncbi:hypothetical protein [Aureliella helgolandensis]|uniref:hypothetical protein n=1 Tax=Aureliella helgolandensis TaxID=2527968 RepID=UPI0011A2AB1E|nr:hypothetical protein [Aureliella helgolandensis]